MEIIDLMSRSWFFHCSSRKIRCDGSKCNREGLIEVDWVIELQLMHFDSCWSYSRLSSILRMSIQLSEKLICFFTISCSRVGGVQKKTWKIDGNHKNFIFHISINMCRLVLNINLPWRKKSNVTSDHSKLSHREKNFKKNPAKHCNLSESFDNSRDLRMRFKYIRMTP